MRTIAIPAMAFSQALFKRVINTVTHNGFESHPVVNRGILRLHDVFVDSLCMAFVERPRDCIKG